MSSKTIAIVGVLIVAVGLLGWNDKKVATQNTNPVHPASMSENENLTIDPAEFESKVDNEFFALNPGAKFTYESIGKTGKERTEVEVTKQTKVILGITTIEVVDRVWLDGQLIKTTRNWYAQDVHCNVWHFGQAVDNFQDTQLVDHTGTWEAGVDGANPGIIMSEYPKIGAIYRQEDRRGQAADLAEILALDETVAVPYGNFDECLLVHEWSSIDPTVSGYKYYCPEIGFLVLSESVKSHTPKLQLIDVVIPQSL